jgi:regulator of sirC expression with transglutaminase-like and TPR domain
MSASCHTFASCVAVQSDEDIELDVAALLISEWAYDALDIGHYRARLDELAGAVRRNLEAGPGGTLAPILALNEVLFEELGFCGNEEDYYDPRNSFLNEVIDRRVGIPISLSVMYMEVARRLGVIMSGVGFPGHFLVRYDYNGATVIIDPYGQGRTLDASDLEALLAHAAPDLELEADMLAPASKRQILLRMLTNLAGIYDTRSDVLRSLEVVERMHALYPDNARIAGELERLRLRAFEVN